MINKHSKHCTDQRVVLAPVLYTLVILLSSAMLEGIISYFLLILYRNQESLVEHKLTILGEIVDDGGVIDHFGGNSIVLVNYNCN